MPQMAPSSSTTGRQLIRLDRIFETASRIEVLRFTVIGLRGHDLLERLRSGIAIAR
jgi:hypothetical protein